jgi:poly-D-alanine transfer protein DltD
MDEMLNSVNAEQEEVVAPQEVEEEGVEEPEVEEASAETEDSTEPQEVAEPAKNSRKDNRQFAAMRRERERLEAELKQIRQELAKKREVTEVLQRYYGLPSNEDELIKHLISQTGTVTLEQYEAAKRAEMELIEQKIQNDPRVIRAMEIEQMQRQQAVFYNDLMEIKSAFPTEKATRIEDLPNFIEFAKKRAKGYTAVDAYKLCCLEDKKPPKSKGEDKKHLTTTGGNSTSSRDIPRDVLELYQQLNPGKKIEDYVAHYNKSRKG